MNILLTSAGRRVKIVEYFKKELEGIGKVIAIDCDPFAPALYFADTYEIVPRIDDPSYLDRVKEICERYQIKAIVSLIDPELSLLAKVKNEFHEAGIQIIASDYDVTEMCLDKYRTFKFLKRNRIPHIPTYLHLEEIIDDLYTGKISYPLIAKPRKGSASQGIMHIETENELRLIATEKCDIIFQPFIKGEEYGIDAYIDLISNETVSVFMKKKLRMRSGETDKSISVMDTQLIHIVKKLITILKPSGPIDIDCFKTDEGFVVSEINPRFGGGYPHAYESGINFIKYILHNVKGLSNLVHPIEYQAGSVLMKYDQLLVK